MLWAYRCQPISKGKDLNECPSRRVNVKAHIKILPCLLGLLTDLADLLDIGWLRGVVNCCGIVSTALLSIVNTGIMTKHT